MTHLALHLISSYLLSKQKQRRSARPVLKKTGFPAAEEQCSTAYCVSCSSACSHTRESRTFSDRRWKARNGKGISMCLGRELQTQKVFPVPFFSWITQFVCNSPMNVLFSCYQFLLLAICTCAVAFSKHRNWKIMQSKEGSGITSTPF